MKSHHHQGYGRLGDGLREAARADDGTVEAIEDPSRRFALGVLWHPEEGEDSALFEALVEEAERYREERAMITVLNPATEQPIAELPEPGVEETDAAVARAKAAFPAWRAVAPVRPRPPPAPAGHARRGARRGARTHRVRRTSASRSPAHAARSAWSPRSSTSTRARSTSTTARRSRSPAASTSPSASRSASSG